MDEVVEVHVGEPSHTAGGVKVVEAVEKRET